MFSLDREADPLGGKELSRLEKRVDVYGRAWTTCRMHAACATKLGQSVSSPTHKPAIDTTNITDRSDTLAFFLAAASAIGSCNVKGCDQYGQDSVNDRLNGARYICSYVVSGLRRSVDTQLGREVFCPVRKWLGPVWCIEIFYGRSMEDFDKSHRKDEQVYRSLASSRRRIHWRIPRGQSFRCFQCSRANPLESPGPDAMRRLAGRRTSVATKQK